MMLIRRPTEPFHQHSHFDSYVRLNKLIQEIILLEDKIRDKRDCVSQIMHDSMLNMHDRSEFFLARETRRKAYNRLTMRYDPKLFTQNEYQSPELIKLLEEDVLTRQRLSDYYTRAHLMIDTLNKTIKKELNKLCQDENFMSRLYVANSSLYNLISHYGHPVRNSHYVTLLKYVYKQETCCTPSSLWSGVAYCGEFPYIPYAIFGDFNRTKVKHEFRSNIIQAWDTKMHNVHLFLNTTLLRDGNDYRMLQFFPERITKIRLRANKYIEILVNQYAKKIFTADHLLQSHHLFNSEIILELIKCDILRVENPFPYGESGLEQLSNLNNSQHFDNYNVRFENIAFPNIIKKKVMRDSHSAFSLYKRIFDTFYKNCYFGKDYHRLKKYIEKTGKQNLLVFLYSDFDFTARTMNRPISRTWSSIALRQKQFSQFQERLKTQILKNPSCQTMKVKSTDFADILLAMSDKSQPLENIEVLFQYDAQQSCVIPEIISLTPGRFLGRYGRYFPELKSSLYDAIYSSKYIQVNIDMNGTKDNISHDNPNYKTRVVLFDLDQKCLEHSERIYFLDELFLDIQKDVIVICDADNNILNFNCASTLSPNGSKIYQLLSYLTNIDNSNCPLGGTARTRMEFNLDYQPRIVMDNLLISRQRWRLCKEDFSGKNNLLELLKWKERRMLPDEFYVYTDTMSKPHYCRLGTTFDVTNLNSIIRKANKYFYIEETYPNFTSNSKFISYNMEVLCQICLD